MWWPFDGRVRARPRDRRRVDDAPGQRRVALPDVEGVADAVGLEVALLLAPRLRLALRVDAANLIGRPAVAATGPDADLSVLERVDLGLRAAAEEGQRYNDLHPCSIY